MSNSKAELFPPSNFFSVLAIAFLLRWSPAGLHLITRRTWILVEIGRQQEMKCEWTADTED